ncbi:SDR family NAD(P)-dependent oxidoreductase [Nocardioides sp. R-C-SC26]|uniref:SDR family NAD(P)-dependent oxidoreductase n=1 Tax=Nocardioides sp. R-C-SC26 TaxID=2870414 RepID=UPI001E4737FE|nr:SDR family NAD(P)-dependent oxidoreductase [Nocardioides sp. R-C-SC26]
MAVRGRLTSAVDAALDRSVVLGYGRVGPALRSRWWPADPPPASLAGKRVLVTGATSGIGAAAVEGLLELGAAVHLLGRNAEKVERCVQSTRQRFPGSEIVGEVCDVGDLDAVRSWTAGALERIGRLDGLLHNAGTMTEAREESPQGHEIGLAVHVLGPHLLTAGLREPLAASGAASVVWMSSGGMYGARLHADDADDIEFRHGEYDGVQAYARTKRMQVELAAVWADALAVDGVSVTSMHPGWSGTPGVLEHLPRFERLTRPLLRTAADAADTAVWLIATRPPSRPPHFWHDRAQRPTTFGWQRSGDDAAVERLVTYVEAVTGARL